MKYFRIKTGYGQNDFLIVDEIELPMAIRAQVNGRVGVFKNGTVTGNHIISITPDWNKLMGWHDNYQPNSEDMSYLPEKDVLEHRKFLEDAIMQVRTGARSGNLLHD